MNRSRYHTSKPATGSGRYRHGDSNPGTNPARPRLLDLFCGAGGATKGYQRAGFYVVGVDIAPQPNYCGDEFIQADAMTWVADRAFDAIHASPPCQYYASSTAWRGRREDHANLIPPTQEMVRATGLPYVIENVPDARRYLHHPLLLCGTGLGLLIRRHRYFELSWEWPAMQHPCHHRPGDFSFDHGAKQPESVYRDAMGCDWMTVEESRQAIPPVYTEHIGHYLLAELNARAAA